jgi:hypothetical protein
MANTRIRKSKYTETIHMVHNDWCRANGYPVRSYKPQAGRPKLQATSFKRLKSQASGRSHQTCQQ